MNNFTYYQPSSVRQAVGLLDAGNYGKTELLGGGTDLLDRTKEYIESPESLISLTAIKELRTIEVADDTITIGAGVTLDEIADHAELKKRFPVITTPVGDIGGPQIRSVGTLGGNLCQRNRCWYFRDEHVPCLLKGGSRCYAVGPDAQNRYHAIFTAGLKCVMVHPSTLVPALIALKAKAFVTGPHGERSLEVERLYHAPSGPKEREHVLAPDEVLTRVEIPGRATRNASYEVRQKYSHDWPFAQAAVSFEGDGPAKNVRIVLGHVAPTPVLSEAAMEAIEGKEVTEETAAAAAEAAANGAKPLSQNAYKVKLLKVAVKRALLQAVGNTYWKA